MTAEQLYQNIHLAFKFRPVLLKIVFSICWLWIEILIHVMIRLSYFTKSLNVVIYVTSIRPIMFFNLYQPFIYNEGKTLSSRNEAEPSE